MGSKQKVYGEGNYKATREYNAATKKFVESGRVDAAARDCRAAIGAGSAGDESGRTGGAAPRKASTAAGQGTQDRGL